jgi:hypothetical protein
MLIYAAPSMPPNTFCVLWLIGGTGLYFPPFGLAICGFSLPRTFGADTDAYRLFGYCGSLLLWLW